MACWNIAALNSSFFATMMFIVYLFSGGLVNPVQVGADEVEKSALLNEVREVVQEDREQYALDMLTGACRPTRW